MNNFENILVALGITEYSAGIYNYAANLATALNAGELIVLNVINTRDIEAVRSIVSMGYEVDGEHYVEGVKAERQTFLDKIMKDSPFPEKQVRTLIKVGNPINRILKVIVQEQVDMLIMGPKGRTDLEHVLVGSVASKLFRRSPVTVISYRDEQLAERLKKRIHADKP